MDSKQLLALPTYLRTQFSDLAGAQHFMWCFVNELEQHLPGFGLLSVGTVAAYCSAVLENGPVARGEFGGTNYAASRYGVRLYKAAWSNPAAVPGFQEKE